MDGDELMSSPQSSPVNGNGFTTKDAIIRLEGKVDTFIATHTQQHGELMAMVQRLASEMALHQADNHPTTVAQLRDAGLREEGRRDMLRVLFGTSVVGLITGIGGLVLAVIKTVGG